MRTDCGHGLWAIACYFNPLGSVRRLAAFRTFAERLSVPLVAVELGFDGRRDLTERDARKLVRVRSGDVLWQKERLLNLAVAALPPDCTQVAWLDGDVVFAEDDWAARVTAALDRHALVQVFERVHEPGPRECYGDPLKSACAAPCRRSFVRGLEEGCYDLRVLDRIGSGFKHGYSIGHGWAARRELLDAFGFYDALVLGTGDKAIVAAAFGRTDAFARSLHLAPRHVEHYRAWAEPFERAVGGSVGYARNTLVHLWHGDVADRRYATRYDDFARFDFDPARDLRLGESGAWRWSSAKPRLHRHVRRYFEERFEDGRVSAPLVGAQV